jgi:hypothetical protein
VGDSADCLIRSFLVMKRIDVTQDEGIITVFTIESICVYPARPSKYRHERSCIYVSDAPSPSQRLKDTEYRLMVSQRGRMVGGRSLGSANAGTYQALLQAHNCPSYVTPSPSLSIPTFVLPFVNPLLSVSLYSSLPMHQAPNPETELHLMIGRTIFHPARPTGTFTTHLRVLLHLKPTININQSSQLSIEHHLKLPSEYIQTLGLYRDYETDRMKSRDRFGLEPEYSTDTHKHTQNTYIHIREGCNNGI